MAKYAVKIIADYCIANLLNSFLSIF